MEKTVLVVGGAGYIGSHTSYLLFKKGYKVLVLDDLSQKQSFNHPWATFIKGDFADTAILERVFKNYKISAVMHFAAFIEVGESVKKPAEFYFNNVSKTLVLLNTMLKFGVKKIIFSSSCCVYGNPKKLPLNEQHPFDPQNPYGKNKVAIEFALQDYSMAYGLNYVALRYFNAAGASPENGLGEQHDPETHIIPLMFRAMKNRDQFKIFGTDYKTKDGTCVRDYIHVFDIAQAHILALRYLEENNRSDSFNLGTGTGYSVMEMIKSAEKICKIDMLIKKCPKRPGDAPVLVADSSKARSLLGWNPRHSSLNNILTTAWHWHTGLQSVRQSALNLS